MVASLEAAITEMFAGFDAVVVAFVVVVVVVALEVVVSVSFLVLVVVVSEGFSVVFFVVSFSVSFVVSEVVVVSAVVDSEVVSAKLSDELSSVTKPPWLELSVSDCVCILSSSEKNIKKSPTPKSIPHSAAKVSITGAFEPLTLFVPDRG